jgi:heavy metal sensor kinase
MLYFLVLLALALGAASLMAFQYAERILADKESARAELLQDGADKASREVRDRLRFDLWRSAAAVANIWAGELRSGNTRNAPFRFGSLATFAGASNPYCLLAAPMWLSCLNAEILQNAIQIHEEYLHDANHDPNLDTTYFQVNFEWGGVWRSRSMGNHQFAFDLPTMQKMDFRESEMRDIELEPTLKVQRFAHRFPARLPAPPRFGRTLPPRRGFPERPARGEPTILVQFAVDTSRRDAALTTIRADLEDKLMALRSESHATLASLRNVLLLVSAVTFAAIVVGGFWLVRVGLSPLKRLSVAVSQISVKDFRLPFDEPNLPIELRPIVERLTQTLELLKRAFAREKQAAADISHDLRTPLAALLTTIEVGLRKPRSPQEYRELLTDCHAAGTQINQLVERLLALARLDAGVDTLRRRNVDVGNLAAQCANLVRPLAEARSLTLLVHQQGPVQANTDADKLREILTNLLHNAVQYNQPHGRIDVMVGRVNGHVHLEVRDTGIGIAPEARDQIFERFYRADRSRHADDGMHAGLGLAIVKGYVDLMGGKIDVESTVGKGSVFSLELPA